MPFIVRRLSLIKLSCELWDDICNLCHVHLVLNNLRCQRKHHWFIIVPRFPKEHPAQYWRMPPPTEQILMILQTNKLNIMWESLTPKARMSPKHKVSFERSKWFYFPYLFLSVTNNTGFQLREKSAEFCDIMNSENLISHRYYFCLAFVQTFLGSMFHFFMLHSMPLNMRTFFLCMRSNNRKQATSPISHPPPTGCFRWYFFFAGERFSLSFVIFTTRVCVCQQHLFSRCNVHFFLFFGTIALLFFLRREVGQHSLLRRPIITVIPAPCIVARIPPVFFLQGKPCQRDSRFSAAANLKLSTLGKSWEILQIVFVRNRRCDNFELIPIWCCGKISPQELGPLSISVKRYEAPFKVCTHGQIKCLYAENLQWTFLLLRSFRIQFYHQLDIFGDHIVQ